MIFLQARDQGYTAEIARFFEADLYPIQKQLDKLEFGGVLVSRKVGRTRIFSFNPRYPFLIELKNLLEKAILFYPAEVNERLNMNRRSDKPL